MQVDKVQNALNEVLEAAVVAREQENDPLNADSIAALQDALHHLAVLASEMNQQVLWISFWLARLHAQLMIRNDEKQKSSTRVLNLFVDRMITETTKSGTAGIFKTIKRQIINYGVCVFNVFNDDEAAYASPERDILPYWRRVFNAVNTDSGRANFSLWFRFSQLSGETVRATFMQRSPQERSKIYYAVATNAVKPSFYIKNSHQPPPVDPAAMEHNAEEAAAAAASAAAPAPNRIKLVKKCQ
jgi:hypothetical protein